MSLVGKKIGAYAVTGEIGAGGMAVVYKAEQPNLDRKVAVKELRGDLSKDPALLQRFEREAKYVAALAHQNIVHIYDFIERAHAMYIVMEYVEGVDLYSLMAQVKRVPPDVAGIIALQAARALEYAHYRGVVHRDFKPSNLMITRHGDIKLMDFGIARDASGDDLTRPGTALGTPSYMSPEQILGERVDFRSDIFSFGIVLYQMLTGQKPFNDDDTRSVMNAILHVKHPRPRSIYPDIPFALQRIIKRCLAKRPSDRYARTEQLRHDLEAYVAETCPVNHNGRMVLYLRHCNLISEEAARSYLNEKELKNTQLTARDRGEVDAGVTVFNPVMQMNSLLFLCMLSWAAWVAWCDYSQHADFFGATPSPAAAAVQVAADVHPEPRTETHAEPRVDAPPPRPELRPENRPEPAHNPVKTPSLVRQRRP